MRTYYPYFILLIAVISLIPLQEAFAGCLSRLSILPIQVLAFILICKEALVVFGSVATIPAIKRSNPHATILFQVVAFYVIYLLFCFWMSEKAFDVKILDARYYALAVFSLIFGYGLARMPLGFVLLERYLLPFSAGFFLFAYIEHYFIPYETWMHWFAFDQVYSKIKGLKGDQYDSGSSLNLITVEAGKRMCGIFGEPLYFAYYSIFLVDVLVVLAFYRKSTFAFITLVSGLICILLSQVRAIWISLALSIVPFMFFSRFGNRMAASMIAGMCAVLLIFSTLIAAVSESAMNKESGFAPAHYAAYNEGLRFVCDHPLGLGIGNAGVMSVQNDPVHSHYFENAYINLAIETGVFGMFSVLLTWLMSIVLAIRHQKALNARSEQAQHYAGVYAPLIVSQYLIAGFFAPHILTNRIGIIMWIFCGVCFGLSGARAPDPVSPRLPSRPLPT